MPGIIDCLTKTGMFDDKQRPEVENRLSQLQKEGKSLAEAEVIIKNDFINEQMKSLHSELNEIKSKISGNKKIKESKHEDIQVPDFAPIKEKYAAKAEPIPEVKEEAPGPQQEGSGGVPTEPTVKTSFDANGPEMAGITHEQMNQIARELGLEEYEPNPEKEADWIAEADRRLKNNPNAISKLLDKMRLGGRPDPVENKMAIKYIASLKARINKNPTPELIKEFKDARELFDIAGRMAGKELVSRKGRESVDDSLADYLVIRGMDKGKTLSQKEINEESIKFNTLNDAKREYKEQYEKEQSQYKEKAASEGIEAAKKEAKKASRKTKEDYAEARKKLLQSIKEKWNSAGKDKLSSDIPYRQQVAAVASDVKELVKILVEEGVQKFEDIIEQVHSSLKGGVDISKADIIDILAGEYNKPKQTKQKKSEQLRLFEKEARLIKEIEGERKKVTKETNGKNEPVTNKRIEELEKKLKELKDRNKEEVDIDEDKTDESKKDSNRYNYLLKKIKKLQEDIKNKNYETEEKPPVVFKKSRKTQELEDKVIKLQKQLWHDRYVDKMKNRTKSEKIYDFVTREILGVRRLAATILDFSIWFRQMGRLALNPRKWDVFGKSVARSFKATFSQKKMDRYMYEIHNSSEFKEMTDDGVRFNEFETNEISKENEFYYKNWMFKIPYFRQIPLSSQRAADSALNIARYELYNKYKSNLMADGITRESDPEIYKAMAAEVMNQTGSGKLLSFFEKGENAHKAQKILGNTLFGARLMAANFNQLNPVYYAKMPKEVRALIWKDIASYVATIMAAGAAAKFGLGATVSFDPDDPEFLQTRIGKNVYDLSGGKVQYIRTALRILKAGYSSAKTFTGNQSRNEMNKDWDFASSSLGTFFRNKLAPNTSYLYTWTFGRGKNSVGLDADPLEIVKIWPMYFDDVKKAFEDEGLISLATTLMPNIIGIGYNSYYSDPALQPVELLLQRNLNSEDMNIDNWVNYKNNSKPLTNEEKDKFRKERDAYIEPRIKKLHNEGWDVIRDGEVKNVKFNEMTKEEISEATSQIKRKATFDIKKKMFGEKRETSDEKRSKKELSKKLSERLK